MLNTIHTLNKALFNFAQDTFEEGIHDAIEAKNAVNALFHEDTQDFYVDFDIFTTENNWN